MTNQALLVMDVQLGIVGRLADAPPTTSVGSRSALDHAHSPAYP